MARGRENRKLQPVRPAGLLPCSRRPFLSFPAAAPPRVLPGRKEHQHLHPALVVSRVYALASGHTRVNSAVHVHSLLPRSSPSPLPGKHSRDNKIKKKRQAGAGRPSTLAHQTLHALPLPPRPLPSPPNLIILLRSGLAWGPRTTPACSCKLRPSGHPTPRSRSLSTR